LQLSSAQSQSRWEAFPPCFFSTFGEKIAADFATGYTGAVIAAVVPLRSVPLLIGGTGVV